MTAGLYTLDGRVARVTGRAPLVDGGFAAK
jgi:hypothetical protein